MSYARFNDVHDDGQLSAFRERLAAEVRAQTGQEFVIFQDRADIAWGENWQRRIDESLDVASVLLAVITPGFFASQACRGELVRFLERERQLGRDDLVLPVYYISARELDDPAARAGDELAGVLASRQFADWRQLRFEPLTSPVVRKAVAQLASRMRDTFWHPAGIPARPSAGRQRDSAVTRPGATPGVPGRVTAKTEPPTHVVDVWGRGDFTTVGAAVEAARPGDRILVRPGLYEEGLVVDKPLEIVGDGPAGEIEVRARGANALRFKASIGRVANLTLRQAGGTGSWYGVDITQGRLDLESCDISCQSSSCVAIRNGADPRLRGNRIHDGKECGVFVLDGGLGTLEDNDITANTLAGVEIKTGGNPMLRGNRIHDGKAGGVFVWEDGLGTLEDNDITANAYTGVEIKTGGNCILRGNRVNRNSYQAVWIYEGGRGVLEDNDLTGNRRGAWDIAKDCEPDVTRKGNQE
jgi:F-box protein 11